MEQSGFIDGRQVQWSMMDLKKWFDDPDNPVSASEFREFWTSCSKEEKDEFILQAQKDLENDG